MRGMILQQQARLPRSFCLAQSTRARNKHPPSVWLQKVVGFLSTKKRQSLMKTKAVS